MSEPVTTSESEPVTTSEIAAALHDRPSRVNRRILRSGLPFTAARVYKFNSGSRLMLDLEVSLSVVRKIWGTSAKAIEALVYIRDDVVDAPDYAPPKSNPLAAVYEAVKGARAERALEASNPARRTARRKQAQMELVKAHKAVAAENESQKRRMATVRKARL